MTERVQVGDLQVARELYDFVNDEVLPGTGIDQAGFWSGFTGIVNDLAPRNRELLEIREQLQAKIDAWHRENPGFPSDIAEYRAFLTEIGYLKPEGGPFSVGTSNTDPEISTVAGPQLVVPVMNARYSLNAANARWGSLYDALYGTDAIPEDGGAERSGGFNPARGAKVIAFARDFLDQSAPLASGKWADVTGLFVDRGALVATLGGGAPTGLADTAQFAGHVGPADRPEKVLLVRHGLHAEIVVDPSHPIGKDDPAGIADVVLEAALTTIMDLEDSIAAVDAEDKVAAYRNWLGLMKGDLTADFEKGGRKMTRRLEPDRTYTAPDGSELTLHGRSLMLVRNVGHLMDNEVVLDGNGNEVPEGIVDAIVT